MLSGQKSMDEVNGEAKVQKCPECNNKEIVLNSDGEMYCTKCGLVLD